MRRYHEAADRFQCCRVGDRLTSLPGRELMQRELMHGLAFLKAAK
jgi:hypothetical protein